VHSGVPLSDKQMVLIAKEMRHSETAFITTLEPENGLFNLRWFTPLVEVKLCGHGTLAAAHTLFEELKVTNPKLTFKTLSGDLTVVKLPNGTLQMDFPRNYSKEVSLPDNVKKALSESLQISVDDLLSFHFDDTTGKLIVEVKHYNAIEQAKPNSKMLNGIEFPMSVRGVSITTSNLIGSHLHPTCDFASRYFAPWVGIDEDPVNGSSHTILAGFYNARLGKKNFVAYMASERTGYLEVHLEDNRVILQGFAVTTLTGKIIVPVV